MRTKIQEMAKTMQTTYSYKANIFNYTYNSTNQRLQKRVHEILHSYQVDHFQHYAMRSTKKRESAKSTKKENQQSQVNILLLLKSHTNQYADHELGLKASNFPLKYLE